MSAIRKNIYYLSMKRDEKRIRKHFDETFKQDIDRFNSSNNKKPEAQIKSEMKTLYNYWHCFPYQYYRFDLYKKDCTFSIEELKNYVPLYFMQKLFYPQSFKDYGVLCKDKLLTYASLKAYDIPQPGMLFFFNNNKFYDGSNNVIAASIADEKINSSTAEKLFVKARFGSDGKGIYIFKRKGNGFIDENNKPFNHRFFFEGEGAGPADGRDSTGFFVVQEGLQQHPAMNAIYPNAINTFRVITECVNSEAKVLYSLIRMGSGGEQVDNASSGGMYIKLDPETGLLADFAYGNNRTTHNSHPDTGYVFKGAAIEVWPQVKRLALESAGKFREMKYLGWDIAFTTNGLSIIEINHHAGVAIVQDCYGGIRKDLKIIPNDWWYRSKFTLKTN